MNATDSTSPTTSTQVWSRAMPATASTLSSDIDMSATTIWTIAPRIRLGGACGVAIVAPFPSFSARSATRRAPDLAPQLPSDPEQDSGLRQAAGPRSEAVAP